MSSNETYWNWNSERLFTAVFRFLRTQAFKRLLPCDVLAPVNQSYERDRIAFETFLNPPTYTDVCTNLSWLVSFHSGYYRSLDWREQKHRIVFLFCAWVRRKRKIITKIHVFSTRIDWMDFTVKITVRETELMKTARFSAWKWYFLLSSNIRFILS